MNPKAILIASRTTLMMLLIAAAVLAGLGVFTLLRTDPPEVDGWLRTIFGKVFAVVAAFMAAILGVPAAIGLWAMAGATAEDAVPALPQAARQGLAIVGIVASGRAADGR